MLESSCRSWTKHLRSRSDDELKMGRSFQQLELPSRGPTRENPFHAPLRIC